MRPHRSFRAAVMVGLLAVLAPLAVTAPARADAPTAEYLYAAGDNYLDQRTQDVHDTSDVLLAMEWMPTVDGTVNGARICLDLDPAVVNARLPLSAYLWSVDGQLLSSGAASEGITGSAPCFYDVGFSSVPVTAYQHYVVGFWVRGGQYSFVRCGFRTDITNETGHIVGLSTRNSTMGNGLYSYTSLLGSLVPFPTESWFASDYLVSPRFTPTATDPAPDPSPTATDPAPAG